VVRAFGVRGLRSALTPVVTQFGIDLGALLGGAVVTETVFSLPGLGKAGIDTLNQQNQPVIIGIVLLASAAIVVANIAVDFVYAVLDPRLRLHRPKGGQLRHPRDMARARTMWTGPLPCHMPHVRSAASPLASADACRVVISSVAGELLTQSGERLVRSQRALSRG
jgi:hypothetical protein